MQPTGGCVVRARHHVRCSRRDFTHGRKSVKAAEQKCPEESGHSRPEGLRHLHFESLAVHGDG